MMRCARLSIIEMENAMQSRRRFEHAFCVNLDAIRFEIPCAREALRGDAFTTTRVEKFALCLRW